jgi:DNA-directed RNA polymerase specialized sigma24 family protein
MAATSQLERTPNRTDPDQLALCAGQIYWLTLLLTDDEHATSILTQASATQVFTGDRVFDRWCAKWVRRATIRACINFKQRELEADERNSSSWNDAADELDLLHRVRATPPNSIDVTIRKLPILPRFVLVMHLLERYSLEETANLLRIPNETCEAGLGYALAALRDPIQSSELRFWIEQHRCA